MTLEIGRERERELFPSHKLRSNCDSLNLNFNYILSDEWENFLERMERERSDESNDELEEEERNWASFRGQTLSRTGGIIFHLNVNSIKTVNLNSVLTRDVLYSVFFLSTKQSEE